MRFEGPIRALHHEGRLRAANFLVFEKTELNKPADLCEVSAGGEATVHVADLRNESTRERKQD